MPQESTFPDFGGDSLVTVGKPIPSLPGLELIASYEPIAPPGFVLMEEVGRGGMGVVYRALDTSFDREVALKVLLPKYLHDAANTSRFLEEARITGQLQHPGIPAVHQTGKLADGCPYLAMKLIRGFTLSDLIWQRKPGGKDLDYSKPHTRPANYLSIFESICQALGYAHAHHVIHRDLKPHNIMVGAYGEVQVMDWGLAKVLPRKPADINDPRQLSDELSRYMGTSDSITSNNSNLTVAGSVLGTPAYMAPEQALGDNTEVGPRADVFGLGALMCCMLTGKPPILGDTPDSERMVSALGLLQETYDRLDACGAEPDLIELVKRCLAVDPRQRPEDGQAVACEVAALRRAAELRVKKAEEERTKAQVHAEELQHRRRLLWGIIAVLLLGMAGTTWGLISASRNEKEARENEEETRSILDFLDQKLLASIRPLYLEQGQGRNVTMRDVLEKARQSLTNQFKEKPLTEARIRMTIGRSFEYLGELEIAQEDLQRALDLRRAHLGPKNKDTLLSLLGIANVHEAMKNNQKALDARQEAYDMSRELFGEQDHVTQMAMNNLASCYERMGRLQEGVDLRERVLALTRKHLGEKNPFTLLCMNNLAASYTFTGKQEEALKLLDEAIELHIKYLSPNHANTLEAICSKAQCLVEMKRAKEAVPLYEKVITQRIELLGQDHHDTLSARMEYCVCLTQLKDYAAALTQATTSLPWYEQKRGASHADTLFCLSLIIQRLHDLKRDSEAKQYLKTFFERYQGKNLQPNHVAAVVAVQCEYAYAAADVNSLEERLQFWSKLNEVDADTKVQEARHWCRLAVLRQKQKQDGAYALDAACGCLQKAAKEGWKQFDVLNEADFKPMRQHPEGQQLLKSLRHN